MALALQLLMFQAVSQNKTSCSRTNHRPSPAPPHLHPPLLSRLQAAGRRLLKAQPAAERHAAAGAAGRLCLPPHQATQVGCGCRWGLGVLAGTTESSVRHAAQSSRPGCVARRAASQACNEVARASVSRTLVPTFAAPPPLLHRVPTFLSLPAWSVACSEEARGLISRILVPHLTVTALLCQS